jgi:hypothetical protein
LTFATIRSQRHHFSHNSFVASQDIAEADMMIKKSTHFLAICIMASLALTPQLSHATGLAFAGSQYDIGGTFFAGGGPANVNAYVVVPWRTSSAANVYSAVSEPGQQYYGRDGYALFGTRFDYPDANLFGGVSFAPNDEFYSPIYPDLIDLPDFVTNSQILASRVVGGYGFALIDDPAQTAGIRDWAWGESQSPQSFGQVPYVKLGLLDGWDQFGHDPTNPDPNAIPAGRWGFEVGEGTPAAFRLGVMSDGTDSPNFIPKEIFLARVASLGNGAILDFVSTGIIDANRFVDMHFFDITDAQSGDKFAIGVKAKDGSISFGNSGLSGFSFDILPAAPGLTGDYNGDSLVDAADYTVWRDTLTQVVTPGDGADGDNSGVIDAGDYTVWVNNYGSLAPSSSIPEPTAVMLAALALMGASRARRTGF